MTDVTLNLKQQVLEDIHSLIERRPEPIPAESMLKAIFQAIMNYVTPDIARRYLRIYAHGEGTELNDEEVVAEAKEVMQADFDMMLDDLDTVIKDEAFIHFFTDEHYFKIFDDKGETLDNKWASGRLIPKGESDFFDYLEKVCNNRGWSILRIDSDGFWVQANYGIPQSPQMLFRVEPTNKRSRILKVGIVPQKGVKTVLYPDRSYLFTTLDACYNWVRNGLGVPGEENSYVKGVTSYDIFSVDSTMLRKGTKFYRDPAYSEGSAVYTPSSIPPTALSLIKTINDPNQIETTHG